MPTTTFFNLPPPKREKLLHAAVAEFARRPYGEVSISRIIQAAEIPRGSFYQYFTDKTDLFRHVLRCCDKLLETAVSRSLDSCGGKPMELPLALFDRVLAYIQANRDDFALFLGILRQNAGMDAGQLLALPDMVLLVLERADWSGLTPESREERLAQARRQLEESRTAMQELHDGEVFGRRRLLAAFPRLRSIDHRDTLERLRRRAERLRKS